MRRFRLSKVQRGLLSGELQAIKAPVGRLITADSDAGKAALPSFLEDLRQIADGLKGIETDMEENIVRTGFVNYYDESKGFGFLKEDKTGEKTLFHFSATNLPPDKIKPLMRASYITVFEPRRGKNKALEIILCENT